MAVSVNPRMNVEGTNMDQYVTRMGIVDVSIALSVSIIHLDWLVWVR
jgi:hypothetical protein